MRMISRLIGLLLLFAAIATVNVTAQKSCLTPDEVKAIIARLNSSQDQSTNKKLHEELLKLDNQTRKLIEISVDSGNSSDLPSRMDDTREKHNARLCEILKESGWPTTAAVGEDGVSALLNLVRTSRYFELQKSLLPVIDAAVKRGDVPKPQLASFIDRVRVDAGVKQLFGTHVRVTEGFLVLVPIEAEQTVNERRKQFGLPPLAEAIRGFERDYQRPLIRAVEASRPRNPAQESVGRAIVGELSLEGAEADDVVRVNTNLVNLNVSVFNNQSQSLVGSLDKADFKVEENGHEERIDYFAATDIPFDLVLLIDLSGSTSQKRDLIRKTTARFIQAARPTDRLAIATFSDTVNVICPLTSDRQRLLSSMELIEGTGGTNFWDALKFSFTDVLGPPKGDRRRAVVAMTDGADNSLTFAGFIGSKTSFADLVEIVRKGNELIVPIYLDTEHDRSFGGAFTKRIYENARNTLALLARESGGFMYKARKLEDLNGVYDQVINDLGKVYSVGYRPTNEKRDGSWRRVVITLRSHPELTARSRPGYYAN
jgi:VWFA-related protein